MTSDLHGTTVTTPEFLLPGSSGIDITFRVIWWWQPLYAFCNPVIEVNSVPQSVRWGRQVIALAAGSYHVRVYFPYMGVKQCGPAEMGVSVPDAGYVKLTYSPPFTMFQRGKLKINTR